MSFLSDTSIDRGNKTGSRLFQWFVLSHLLFAIFLSYESAFVRFSPVSLCKKMHLRVSISSDETMSTWMFHG